MPDDLADLRDKVIARLHVCEACGTRGGHTDDCSVHRLLDAMEASLDRLGSAARSAGVDLPHPPPTAIVIRKPLYKRILSALFRRRS
jgi:hypothetical protein